MPQEIRLFNTLTQQVEALQPRQASAVTIYTCGPTVYGELTLGNWRAYLIQDMLVRALALAGYQPERVMNITDVGHLVGDADDGEDKLQVGARREKKTAWEVARQYEDSFLAGLGAFNLIKPDKIVRATDTIAEQIAFVKDLEDKGFTYRTSDGIYYDSSKFPDYGALARLDIAGLQAGARVDVGEKRHVTDFALWKFSANPGERDMEWESPWGVGYPGWHIECSAIIHTALGEQIDIHCGGVDHIPVHHTNEIAQSEARFGVPLANLWMHNEFLLIDGGRMGKSLGNGYTIQDLRDHGHDPLAYRYFSFSAHYRAKLNFTWAALDGAATALERLRNIARSLPSAEGEPSPAVANLIVQAEAALFDDLNLPKVLGLVWEGVRSNLSPEEKGEWLRFADGLLALDLFRPVAGKVPADVMALVQEREEARQAKDWQRADALRDEVVKRGFQIQDNPDSDQPEVVRIPG